jgi:hypothetical protein
MSIHYSLPFINLLFPNYCITLSYKNNVFPPFFSPGREECGAEYFIMKLAVPPQAGGRRIPDLSKAGGGILANNKL